jgi:hypothetical protein
MKFKTLRLRARDIDQLVGVRPESVNDVEQQYRATALLRMRNTIYTSWPELALEHFDRIPERAATDDGMLSNFLSAYVAMLWRFKRLRKGEDKVSKYAVSIRINAYDRTLREWKSTSRLYGEHHLDRFEFHEKFTVLAISVGMLMRELELIGNHQMNAGEYLIQREIVIDRAGAVRHAENRSMKADVFKWLDANKTDRMSMDAAAQAIIKQQPIAFRTARDWVADWKKLRSTSRP